MKNLREHIDPQDGTHLMMMTTMGIETVCCWVLNLVIRCDMRVATRFKLNFKFIVQTS